MAQAIISPHFCSPYPVDLGIVRQVLSGNFSVKDVNGNTVFKVKGAFLSLRERRVLVDGAGNPIVTLQKKLLSTHHRWEVYRGDSTDSGNLVFSVKKSSVVQLKTKLHVFLANNKGEYAPDFKVKGSWFEQSCVVYSGKSKSSNILAEMHKKHTVTSVLFGKDNFMVTVYPGVDQALIVALIFILNEMNFSGSGSNSGSGGD
ncbi:putative tubby-like domain-containing protein [Rosa chinensis]|uniref:Putative tubby-like domain-containing protein n=1 Tax=Rosa chinensis TaxID=74649 RepID=A0A2P6R8M3_ROSCH|nr:protein LURP-one-related 15 [Rosa chinensis]PRQ42762.1 putative tubby-like domain-containing protein [Rosa chinensis]